MADAKPDLHAPSFRGALMRDHWHDQNVPQFASIPSSLIGDVQRASDAISTIARLVHNSLCEPQMSGAEPLGLSAHLGLLNAADLIGEYLHETAEKMHDCARSCAGLTRAEDVSQECGSCSGFDGARHSA